MKRSIEQKTSTRRKKHAGATQKGAPALLPLYQPLQRNEIRLLTLVDTDLIRDPALGAADLTIVCKLETVSLADVCDDQKPGYAALSYVWGSIQQSRRIICNGHVISITSNLFDAFRSLLLNKDDKSGESRPQRLWVDAVCIDQDHSAEKTQQVAKMDQIYGKAELVIVWLGSGAKRAGPGFDEYWNFVLSDVLSTSMSDDVKLAGRNFIKTSDWFTRSWTLQEIVLARMAEVRCGHRRVGWDQFVSRNKLLLGRVQELHLIAKAIKYRGSFFKLVKSSAGRTASDPRDEIFSLLCMYTGHRNLGVTLDYDLPATDVRSQAGLALLQRFGNLDIFMSSECLLRWSEYNGCAGRGDYSSTVTISFRNKLKDGWNSMLHSWCPSFCYLKDCDSGKYYRSRCNLGTIAQTAKFARSYPAYRHPGFLEFTRINPDFAMNYHLDGKYLTVCGAVVGRCLIDRLTDFTDVPIEDDFIHDLRPHLYPLPECVPTYIKGNIADKTFVINSRRYNREHSYADVFEDPLKIMRCLHNHDNCICNCPTDCKPFTRNSRRQKWPRRIPVDPMNPPSYRDNEEEEFIGDLKSGKPFRHHQVLCCALFGSSNLVFLKPIFLDQDCSKLVFEPYAVLENKYAGLGPRYIRFEIHDFSGFYTGLADGKISEVNSSQESPSQNSMASSQSSIEDSTDVDMTFVPVRFKLV